MGGGDAGAVRKEDGDARVGGSAVGVQRGDADVVSGASGIGDAGGGDVER